MSAQRNRAVFLDRDGTIIRDVDYLSRPQDVHVLPGVPAALRRLKEAGFLLLVVTNQSAIARGWLTEDKLHEIHRELNRLLESEGAAIDAFYHCPHLPDGTVAEYARQCTCRKPEPGLLERAARDWNVELGSSYMVGDSERDTEAGQRVGCCTVLIGRGPSERADARAGDLAEAADLILRREISREP